MKPAQFRFALGFLFSTAYCLPPTAYSQKFDRTVIDANFPGAYQVEVADINGDKKPDIIAVGGSTCAWYENPTWKKRIVTGAKQTPGIISSATADIDGDGKAEIAIAYEFAMNTPTTGKLLLAVQGNAPDHPWKLVPIVDIGSIHRLRWGDINGDKRLDLVVAPIFGPNAKPPTYDDPARLVFFDGKVDIKAGKTASVLLARRPVLHAIELHDGRLTGGLARILTADNLGVGMIDPHSPVRDNVVDLVAGAKGDDAKRGCSEVHLGHFQRGDFLATLEPWHGNRVVVYSLGRKEGSTKPGLPFPSFATDRHVLDDTLADGHALWVADVDGDGDDEVFAGHRGKDHRVSMYDFDRSEKTWSRNLLDREVAAQDLRGGDLDGDGTPDVVAVGGSTHNVVWYHFRRN